MLLIAAVELQQLNGIFTEANLVIAQLGEQWLPQMLAVELALLRFGEFDCFAVRHWHRASAHSQLELMT